MLLLLKHKKDLRRFVLDEIKPLSSNVEILNDEYLIVKADYKSILLNTFLIEEISIILDSSKKSNDFKPLVSTK